MNLGRSEAVDAWAASARIIVGADPWLREAAQAARASTLSDQIRVLAVERQDKFVLPGEVLEADRSFMAFAAWGPEFSSIFRLELYGLLKSAGFRLPPLVDPTARVAPGVQMAENVFVGAGAIIGEGTRLGLNARIGAGAIVGCGVQVGPHCWIAPGAQLRALAKMGAHCRVEAGVVVSEGAVLGRFVTLERPGTSPNRMDDGSFQWEFGRLDGCVVDYGGGRPRCA